MFERNKIDNSLQVTTVPAEITLDGGEILKGRFIFAAARSIYDVLNGDTHFLDFETYKGERSLIARTTIKTIRIVSVPGAPNLKSRIREGETFDPHAVLAVDPDATWDTIRASYVKLSKTYHPDRFAGLELPMEVREYLAVMARRINAAYGALEAPVMATKRAAINKAAPIYTTPARP